MCKWQPETDQSKSEEKALHASSSLSKQMKQNFYGISVIILFSNDYPKIKAHVNWKLDGKKLFISFNFDTWLKCVRITKCGQFSCASCFQYYKLITARIDAFLMLSAWHSRALWGWNASTICIARESFVTVAIVWALNEHDCAWLSQCCAYWVTVRTTKNKRCMLSTIDW